MRLVIDNTSSAQTVRSKVSAYAGTASEENPAPHSHPVRAPSHGQVEEWGHVPGYCGLYEVSSFGAIRRADSGFVLSPFKTKSGYLIIRLSRDSKSKNHRIHRLVAAVFIRPPKAGEQVNHKDFDKLNNTVSNLEWCSAAENNRHFTDAVKAGRVERPVRVKTENYVINRPQGERNRGSKIKEADALEIIHSSPAVSDAQLAERFGLTRQTISRIRTGKRWAHLHRPSESQAAGADLYSPWSIHREFLP